MSQTKNSDPKISKELKPAEPSSTLIVENIRPLSEFLVPKWKEFVINDISVLTGRKTIGLFDLEKMNEFKLKEIDSQLQSQLPGDIYDFLKYERRRVQKKSKRKIREKNVKLEGEIDELVIIYLKVARKDLVKEKTELLRDIYYYQNAINFGHQLIWKSAGPAS